MAELNRRGFLKAGTIAAAGAAAVASGADRSEAHSTLSTTLPYSRTRVANLKDLRAGRPVQFAYPDPSAPSILLKLGAEAAGGIGPDRDVVAYSVMCTHKGCPVSYNADDRMIVCPCHFSTFDPAKNGQMIIGQATQNLPRIELAIEEKTGDIFATGIRGLLYGRAANVIRA